MKTAVLLTLHLAASGFTVLFLILAARAEERGEAVGFIALATAFLTLLTAGGWL